MPFARRSASLPALLLAALLPLVALGCPASISLPFFAFATPLAGLLAEADGPLEFELVLPPFVRAETLQVRLEAAEGGGSLAPSELHVRSRRVAGRFTSVPAGRHLVRAEIELRLGPFAGQKVTAATWVEAVALPYAGVCENLNAAECLLPFPSSRFLVPAKTKTGFRVELPQEGMPVFQTPISAAAFSGQDGFSPMVQILTHLPGGVDPALSNASRLLGETRSYGTRSLEASSPTLLLDADAGLDRVLHFVERDVNAPGSIAPEREILFLRPGTSLAPGHRYVVAMRGLRHPDGSAVQAEPVFATLRDRRPTSIAGVEAERAHLEEVFALLARAGVDRRELVLAFDFVVQSDEDLTRAALAMRDRSFDWLAAQSEPTFSVAPFVTSPAEGEIASTEYDCTRDGALVWRKLRGTFRVPLFLSSDPLLQPGLGGRLRDVDADGLPDASSTMDANFTITIPCSALAPGGAPLRPLLVGHGLFGDGYGMVNVGSDLDRVMREHGLGHFDRVVGATDWLGLSTFDFDTKALGTSFIVRAILFDLSNFGALPDRLRQGMTNALVLARMLKQGLFGAHPAFQTPAGASVFAGPAAPLDYLGISLGGILGIELGALSPDVSRLAVDVPASNFSLLLQRSRAISLIGTFLYFLNQDPMSQLLFFDLAEELWDSGESAGYLNHVTRDPLPGSGPPKQLLMTVARYDGIVSNEASEITARTLGLPNLRHGPPAAGSAVAGLPAVQDVAPPLDASRGAFVGAQVWHDLGMYGDLSNPELAKYAPPLANTNVDSSCDPHGQSFSTPAETQQIVTWLDTGVIDDFCNGVCDGVDAVTGEPEPLELPGGRAEPCDPRAKPPPPFGG